MMYIIKTISNKWLGENTLVVAGFSVAGMAGVLTAHAVAMPV
ncbi:hypothetical protein [Chitinilyticum aquatile]|nr:hypothetical protein [Chitinilyticum aquatile]